MGIGLGMVEMGSVGVLHCVSECSVAVYCVGVSITLLRVDLFIGRHADHLQFLPVDTENMYILHLQAHWTCVIVFTAHWTWTFSDEISLVYPFPLLCPHKMGEHLDNWVTSGIKEILCTGCV